MAARQVRWSVTDLQNRVHIQLRGIPRTAVPKDLRRLCLQSKVENVQAVEVEYKHFEPRSIGWITLTSPEFMNATLNALNSHVLHTFPIRANSSPPPYTARRVRGVSGRSEGAQRGLLTGNGPSGGIVSGGRCVAIYGLPGKLSADALRTLLRNFKLAGSNAEEKDINKIPLPRGEFSLLSRHLVRLSNVAEAQRLVRKLHQTFYMPEIYNKRYPIRARVIY